MFGEGSKRLDLSVAIGIIGLFVVIWGGYAYFRDLGFITQPAQPSQVKADYSAVGGSGQTKNLSQASVPSGINTTSGPKSNNVIVAPVTPIVHPKLPYKAKPFDPTAWIYDWGTASIADGRLDFGASTSTAGGDLFLANSNAWTNYTSQANVDWVKGESFGIIARLADGKNFVYCDFGNGMAQIVLRTNGVDKKLVQSNTANAGAGTIQNLGISVYGNEVACTLNGVEVLATTISQGEPAQGGVGLISWDATLGVSAIMINDLAVTELTTNSIITPFPVPSVATTSQAVVAPAPTTGPAKLKLPYSEDNFTGDTNWQGTWGVMTLNSSTNFMEIGSAADTSGGSAILNNTDSWLNYRVGATVDWLKGKTFMMMARYVDTGNYVACNFIQDPSAPGTVTINLEKFVNGNEAILQTGQDTNFLREGNTNIGVSLSVQDAQATCSFNNHSVNNINGSSYGISPVAGIIGFSTWDPSVGNTQIVVKNVTVVSNY